VADEYDSETHVDRYEKVATSAQEIHDLVVECTPDRVVFEVCSCAGWVYDLICALGIEVQVAYPSHEGWRWRNVRRKNDRLDAKKLARYSANEELPLVHMPSPQVRQWRAFIRYRKNLANRRTAIKNNIHALVERAGLTWPGRSSEWTRQLLSDLEQLSLETKYGEFWCSELSLELQAYAALTELIKHAEAKLGEYAKSNECVRRLQSIPGIGPRASEAIVAVLDDPHRFRSGKQVGSYIGLTPLERQSGSMNHQGRISRQGNRLLRSLLVEASWVGIRVNPWLRGVYQRALRGSPSRKKIAIVAVARRLLIRCWTLMKNGQRWRPEAILKVA
jgi:transposase